MAKSISNGTSALRVSDVDALEMVTQGWWYIPKGKYRRAARSYEYASRLAMQRGRAKHRREAR
jgi:hypothetical protein